VRVEGNLVKKKGKKVKVKEGGWSGGGGRATTREGDIVVFSSGSTS
jgi:hypothetical protein